MTPGLLPREPSQRRARIGAGPVARARARVAVGAAQIGRSTSSQFAILSPPRKRTKKPECPTTATRAGARQPLRAQRAAEDLRATGPASGAQYSVAAQCGRARFPKGETSSRSSALCGARAGVGPGPQHVESPVSGSPSAPKSNSRGSRPRARAGSAPSGTGGPRSPSPPPRRPSRCAAACRRTASAAGLRETRPPPPGRKEKASERERESARAQRRARRRRRRRRREGAPRSPNAICAVSSARGAATWTTELERRAALGLELQRAARRLLAAARGQARVRAGPARLRLGRVALGLARVDERVVLALAVAHEEEARAGAGSAGRRARGGRDARAHGRGDRPRPRASLPWSKWPSRRRSAPRLPRAFGRARVSISGFELLE